MQKYLLWLEDKLHLNFMPFKYSSTYCKAQRGRWRGSGRAAQTARERKRCTNEWALHVGLSRHSGQDISVHKWSTLQGRPTHQSPLQLPPHPNPHTHIHARTFLLAKHTSSSPWSVCFRLSPRATGGRERDKNSSSKHSFTTALLSGISASTLFVCHFLGGGRPAQCRVLSALNGVNSCWCGRETDLNLLLPVFKV